MTLTIIDTPVTKRSRKVWIVGSVALALTVAWAVFGHRYSNSALAYQVGTSLFIAGAISAIAYFGFLRNEPIRHLRRNLFLVLFAGAMASSLAMASTPTVNSDMAQDKRDYEHEMAGLNAGVVPADVASDPTLVVAKAKAQRAVEIVAKYRALAHKRLAEASNPGRNQALMEERWSYETQVADLELQMINLLIDNRSKWAIQNNAFSFFDQSVLDKYNADILAIRAIAKKEDGVQAELAANR